MNGTGNGNEPRWTSKNVNTILLWISIAALGFIAYQGNQNALQLARLEGSLITRPEVEAKIAEVKASQTSDERELLSLKLALAERGIKAKGNE